MSKPTVYFFGGSFDPLHLGHEMIVAQLLKDNLKVLIAPTNNPWKRKGLLSLSERIFLIQERYKEDNQVEVLTEGFEFTIDFIKKYAPQYNLILVMGQDAYEIYPQWKEYSKVKSLISSERVFPRTIVSGTEIRANLAKCYGNVSQVVYDYLLINKINYKKPAVTVDVILLNNDRKVLIMKRNTEPFKDCWVFPGGFVDEGEDPKEAALRELLEETGIDIAPVKVCLNEIFYKMGRDPRGWVLSISYVVKLNCNPEPKVTENQEATLFRWVDANEFVNLKLGFDHNDAATSAYLKGLLFG